MKWVVEPLTGFNSMDGFILNSSCAKFCECSHGLLVCSCTGGLVIKPEK